MNGFKIIRKGWHRKDLGDGAYRHLIKTGSRCWRICENSERRQHPSTVVGTHYLGWEETVAEAQKRS